VLKQDLLNILNDLSLTDRIFENMEGLPPNTISNIQGIVPKDIKELVFKHLYPHKLKKLQKEFVDIKKTKKWQFDSSQSAIFNFVVNTEKSTTFTVEGYTITLAVGTNDFGFKHFILKHYGSGCNGEVKAIDILKIGNIIKNDIVTEASDDTKIKFTQNKGDNVLYTLIVKKKKHNELIVSFFSSK